MTWVKVDEQMTEHPKFVQLGPDRLGCIGLWMVGLCYCNRHLTDGFVPEAVIPARSGRYVARLLEAGLWEAVDGGYQMHDFHDYQPSRERVLADRRRNAERAAHARQTLAASAPGVTSTRPVPVRSVGLYNPPTPHKPGLHDGSHPNCLVCGTAA